MTPTRRPDHPAMVELEAEANQARWRLALYRRRVYLGRGDARRLDELERGATTAAQRLRRARDLERS